LVDQEKIHNQCLSDDPKERVDALEELKSFFLLIIQKELDISESPEYQKIKYENSVLQTETARHVVERSELQELRAEIERMKKINRETGKYQQKVINFDDPMVTEQLKKFLNENS
jgi:hypothetical protein